MAGTSGRAEASDRSHCGERWGVSHRVALAGPCQWPAVGAATGVTRGLSWPYSARRWWITVWFGGRGLEGRAWVRVGRRGG